MKKQDFSREYLRHGKSLSKTTGKRPNWFFKGGYKSEQIDGPHRKYRYLGRLCLLDTERKEIVWMSRYILSSNRSGNQVYDGGKRQDKNHIGTYETDRGVKIPTSTIGCIKAILNCGNTVIGAIWDTAQRQSENNERQKILNDFLSGHEVVDQSLDNVRIGPDQGGYPAGCGYRLVDSVCYMSGRKTLVKVKRKLDSSTIYTAIGQAIINKHLYEKYNVVDDNDVQSVVIFGSSEYDFEGRDGVSPIIAKLASELEIDIYLPFGGEYIEIGQIAPEHGINTDQIKKEKSLTPNGGESSWSGQEVEITRTGMEWPDSLKIDKVEILAQRQKCELTEIKPKYNSETVATAFGQLLVYREGVMCGFARIPRRPNRMSLNLTARFGGFSGKNHHSSEPWKGVLVDVVELLSEYGIAVHIRSGGSSIKDLTADLQTEWN